MSDLKRIYQQIKQSNPGLNDDLARQRAWVARDRFVYESSQSVSSSAAAAAGAAGAAGAGAGGAGGGAGSIRKRQIVQDFTKIGAEHFCVTWADVITDTWKIIVYNYTSGQLSSPIDTGLIYDSNNQWDLTDDENAVSELGHSVVFRNNIDNKYKIFFFNSNGQTLAIKDLDTNKDFQYTENAQIYAGQLNGISTVYHFDGANVRTHQFPNVNISNIEVDDASDDDVTKDGSVVIEAPNNLNFYIARPSGSLVDITTDMLGLNTYRTSYSADFIFKVDADKDIKAISQDGTLKNTFDLTPFSASTINETSLYGDNCGWASINTNLGYKVFVSYDGDSNQFVSFTFSNSLNSNFSAFEIDWYYTKPSFGKTLVYWSNTNYTSNSIGYVGQNYEIKWLPKGASSFESHYFGSGTISFIEGMDYFTGNRTFTLGENPIIMFAEPEGEIQVGFLTSGGFLTQSTGILAASCSNIWGKPVADKTFALFDVDYTSDRIWQIYGATSIEAQTMTSGDWNWGDSDDNVHRNGTLVVLDDSVGTQSFIYTTEIGLTAGPTYSGDILNVVNSGNRTGLSTEYQIVLKYVEGESNVEGFYLVSKSGLSELVECFPGLTESSNYVSSEYMIGPDLISLSFEHSGTGYRRVQNYKTSNLDLIDDFEFQPVNNYYLRLYKNRCLIGTNSDVEYSFRFVGVNGVDTYSLQANSINTEANDTQDNN
jgi:hypothetical protein